MMDPWAASLKYLMGAVCASGAVPLASISDYDRSSQTVQSHATLCTLTGVAIVALMRYIQRSVITDPECMADSAIKKAKTKTKM